MKRNVLITVFAILLGLSLMGCQREQPVETTVYSMYYCIDNNVQQTSLKGNDELSSFIFSLMPYAYNGHTVVFSSEELDAKSIPSKNRVVFRTTSDTVAAAWATEKYLQGYTVTVTFDTTTNEYICSAEIKGPRSSRHPLSSEMLLGLWEQTDGCPCSNGSDLCFYSNGKLFLSQRCDSGMCYYVERDTLWIDELRPATVQFDTFPDGTITMNLQTRIPLCLQPIDYNAGRYDYTYMKKNGQIDIINSISSEDIRGIWAQQKECNCVTFDTLRFDDNNLVHSLVDLSPRKYCASGNILYEMTSSNSIVEHPVKLAVYPDGRKVIRIGQQINYCNTNEVMETLNYISVQE